RDVARRLLNPFPTRRSSDLEYRPDMIVLDVMLPDINGKEVCHRVRSDPSLEEVRILCISGMVEEDKIQELKLAGADDFLHKPFEDRKSTRLNSSHQIISYAV